MIRSRRTKPRPGRMDSEEIGSLRELRHFLDGGRCTVCGKLVHLSLPQEDASSMHLAHIRGKRMWGDSPENTQTECGSCHRTYHNYGPSRTKPCPPK